MKNLKYIRIVFIIVFLATAVIFGFSEKKIETNIIQAILPETSQESQLLNLTKKYSDNINIIFEADSGEAAESLKTEFYNKIDKNIFVKEEFNFEKIFEEYKKSQDYVLSNNDRKLLLNKEYKKLEENAKNKLYNPFGVILTEFESDPYLLFSDFLLSLNEKNSFQNTNFYNNKYYSILNLKLNKKLKNSDIKNLIELKSEFEKDNNKIYFTGTPIHSYYTSKSSEREINIICIVTTIFIFGLCFLYFRSIKIIIPIIISISLGILAGFFVTSIIFKEVHILTFVFATTLIGICIDYSLHYFLEQNIKNIIKPLTSGLITTISAFLILLFSDMILLKQIAVFVSTGLIFVYLFVILFYPLVKFNINFNPSKFVDKLNLLQNKKIKIIVLPVVFLVICFGLFKLSFNDDIRSFYTPKGELLKSEELLQNLKKEKEGISFLLITNKNFQTLLEENENIVDELLEKNVGFVSISDFLPSIKRQKENFKLKSNLYQNNLNSFNNLLTLEQINKLKNKTDDGKYITYNSNLNFLEKFFVDDNTTLTILFRVKNSPVVNNKTVKFINIADDISQIVKSGRNSCKILFIPVLFILYVIVTIFFGFKKAIFIILPSVIGSFFSLAIFGLLNIEANIFNILAIFLIIGFSLDYSIFRFNGVKNSDSAVFVSCITSFLSFFLLSMTSFKLISSFGLMISIGLLTSYILSFLLISKE